MGIATAQEGPALPGGPGGGSRGLTDHLEVEIAGAPKLNVLFARWDCGRTSLCWCRRGDLNPHDPFGSLGPQTRTGHAGPYPSVRKHLVDLRLRWTEQHAADGRKGVRTQRTAQVRHKGSAVPAPTPVVAPTPPPARAAPVGRTLGAGGRVGGGLPSQARVGRPPALARPAEAWHKAVTALTLAARIPPSRGVGHRTRPAPASLYRSPSTAPVQASARTPCPPPRPRP